MSETNNNDSPSRDGDAGRNGRFARPSSPTLLNAQPPVRFSKCELELVRIYYDPCSPGYHKGGRAAKLAGFGGKPDSLAVQASRTLRKARQCGQLAKVLKAHGLTLDRIAARLSDCLNAQRTRAFLTPDGSIVYAELGPDYQVQMTAAKLLLPLFGVFDSKRQEEMLLADVDDAMTCAEEKPPADHTVDAASESEGRGPAIPANEMEGDRDAQHSESCEHSEPNDDSGRSEVTVLPATNCSVQSAEQALAFTPEEALAQGNDGDTRVMIRCAFKAIQSELEPSYLSVSESVPLLQSLAAVIRESNEADKIDLERQKRLGTALDPWGVPTIDGVLVSDMRQQVDGTPVRALLGPLRTTEAGRAEAASTDNGNADADAVPGRKPVPPEIVEAIREVDEMSPAERMLAKSIFFGVQNLARLELQARAEEEAAAQVETDPKSTEGEQT